MRRHGSSLVLVTHKPAVLALTDKLLLLHGGRLQRFGATAEVLASASPPAAGPGADTADAGVRFRLPAGTGDAGRRCAGRSGAMSGQARLREVGAGGAALELDEKRFSRLGWGLVLLGFVGFLLWAGLAPLDKGVGVSGTVMVAGSRKAVQHPTGGLVRHIRVHEGERVEAGQVLLEMDATQARAQADGLFAQYLAALASLARLSAERDEKARIEFPAELLALDDPRLPTLLEQQRRLHDSRRRALRLELDGLAETVAGSQAQLDGLQAALRREQQRAALEEQLRGLRQLASEGYVPRNRLLDSERLLAQVSSEIAGDLGSLGSTRRQILELRLRMAQRREKFQEEVRASLADAQVRAEELRNRLASARFDLANSEVRAPVAGLVVGQEVFTEGGVIAPGQQLMEILPGASRCWWTLGCRWRWSTRSASACRWS